MSSVAPPKGGFKTESERLHEATGARKTPRKWLYILMTSAFVTLYLAIILPVFTFKKGGQSVTVHWFQSDASTIKVLEHDLITQTRLAAIGLSAFTGMVFYANAIPALKKFKFMPQVRQRGRVSLMQQSTDVVEGSRKWLLIWSALGCVVTIVPGLVLLAFYLAYVRKNVNISDVSAPWGLAATIVASIESPVIAFLTYKVHPGKARMLVGAPIMVGVDVEKLRVTLDESHQEGKEGQVLTLMRISDVRVHQEHFARVVKIKGPMQLVIIVTILSTLLLAVAGSLPIFTYDGPGSSVNDGNSTTTTNQRRSTWGVDIALGQGQNAFYVLTTTWPKGTPTIWRWAALLTFVGSILCVALSMSVIWYINHARRLLCKFKYRMLWSAGTAMLTYILFSIYKYSLEVRGEVSFSGVTTGWGSWLTLLAALFQSFGSVLIWYDYHKVKSNLKAEFGGDPAQMKQYNTQGAVQASTEKSARNIAAIQENAAQAMREKSATQPQSQSQPPPQYQPQLQQGSVQHVQPAQSQFSQVHPAQSQVTATPTPSYSTPQQYAYEQRQAPNAQFL